MKTKLSFLARSVILLWMLVVGSVVHIDAKTIYFVNVNNWTNLHCHSWNGGTATNWPGQEMTETDITINGFSVYSVTLADEANTQCVFNDGNDNKTIDLNIPSSDKALYYSGTWKENHESYSIYLKASAVNWWTNGSAIQKATFKISGTVVTGTLVNETDKIYKYVMPAGWDDTVSFGRYNPANDERWNTTDDISIPAGKNYVTAFTANSSIATWDNYIKYYINHPWDGDTENWTWKELTDNGDGTYSIEDFYGGVGCNWNTISGDDGAKWIGSPILQGYPVAGDECKFTLDPSKNEGQGSIYIARISYNITYVLNGGGNPSDVKYAYSRGAAFTLPIPTSMYYTFAGWYDNASFNGSAVTEIPKGSTGNKTFYAKWDELMHIVNVSADTGGTVSATSVSVGAITPKTITATPNSGYRFVSWVKEGNVTITDANSATTTITATGDDAYVTALFEKEPVVVKDIYVVGRFKVRDSEGSSTFRYTGTDDGDWNDDSQNIKFAYDETTGFYKLPTYCSLTELASLSPAGNNNYYYFHLKDNGTVRGALAMNDCPTFTAPSTANVKDGNDNFLFTTTGDDLVTLYYDPDNSKLWYTTGLGINVNFASGVTLKNTDAVKITVSEAVQWSYSVNDGTPIYVMDGHTSEYAYMPVGNNVSLKITAIGSNGEQKNATYTYTVTADKNVVTVYWDNYQPDCDRATHRDGAATPHDKPALDQAWIWYSNQSGIADTDNPDFSAANHQGARLDTEGRFLYANVSFPRLGKYMVLFRNKEKTASNGDWLSYYQTVEFTGEDKEKASLYGTVMTSGTNTFKVQDVHKWSVTQGSVGQTREMWEVDYFDPESSVIFNPTTVTVEKNGNITSDPVGTKATIYDNATVTITPQNVTSWRYKLNDGSWSEYLHSTSESLDIEKLIEEHKINASEAGTDNTITVELVYALNSAKSISKEVTATYSVKQPKAKVNVHVSFPYGIYNDADFNDAAAWRIAYEGQNGSGNSVTETAFSSLKKDDTMTENDPKKYEWYSTSVAVAGADVQKIRVDLQDNETLCAYKVAESGSDVYFVVVYNDETATSTHTTEEAAIDAEVDLPVIAATPSQTFVGTTDATANYSVSKAETATLNGSSLTLTGGSANGTITVPTTGTTTMTIKAVNSAGYPLELTRTYDVNTSDLNGYYLVVNNTRSANVPGTNIVKYKFQPVLNRGKVNADLSETLYTLTLPDFVLTGEQGRAENPNCFDSSDIMYYTIQKGDGSIIYQPTSSTKYGDTYYAGHNEDGHKYIYVWNQQEPNKEHYISVNGAAAVKMSKGDNMKINGHGPIWYYDLGTADQSNTKFTVTLDYNPSTVIPGWSLYGKTNSSFASVKMVNGAWESTLAIAPAEDKTTTAGKNYELGYEDGKFTENYNDNLTNVQMESYGAHINKNKDAADDEGYNFFLKKDKLAKSYTWYLNIGESSYAPAANNPRFTSNAQSVAIAANRLVSGYTKNAIVEQTVIGKSDIQDYYLTGNLKAGAGSLTWDPVNNKMRMTRMFFKDGKSYVAGSTGAPTVENCDSIVYVLQMVRPEAGWGNMYLSMTGARNLDKYSNPGNVTAWWATLIRPQVFTDKDAQWNFGGLEVNGCLHFDGSYTTSYANTSQAINPILDNTVTGYTAYFNMTNATYRLVYYTESNSKDEGLFIIGPAVAKDGEIDGDETYHAANGRKVKLYFNSATGAYEAENVKLTNGKGFRFANIKQTTTVKTEGTYVTDTQMKSAYESYYDEDAIVPARDGEPGNEAWKAAQTWETDYFNRLSKLKNADEVQVVTDGTPVTFELPTGTYNVRFYTKYLGENDETVTNAYYTIDYHIGLGDAANFGTDLSKGAGSAFAYHKTWSSRLAYVNNGLDAYYVSGWTWNKDDEKKTATASVTLSKMDKPAYLAAGMPMILTDDAINADKKYVIVPGDPYGLQQAVKNCYRENSGDGISVRPIYETEDYTVGMKSEKGSQKWLQWSNLVGPGAYNTETNAYTTRNFTFAMIVPTWNTDKKKELDFWRVKSTNNKMTGHKFLVVASVPEGTLDLESGNAFTSYQSGSNAKSMANYMTISIEGDDEDITTDIKNIESAEEIISNGRIYNLMGVEVKTPVRGQVYIINGRKAIMK